MIVTKEELEEAVNKPFKAIQIETLHGCNLNCKTCPNSLIEKHNELMDEKIYFKILDDLKKANFGGRISPYLMNEPTLDKRLHYFIQETKKMFPDNLIYISSNGLLLDNAEILKLFESGVGRLVITCYSKPIYDKLKNWETDDRIKIITTHDKDPDVQFFNRGGNVDVGDEGLVMETCSKVTKQAFVNYLGDVIICCSDYRYEVVAGNVMKKNLYDLYNCEKFKHYRRKLLCKDRKDLKLCETCNWHRPQQRKKK